MFDTLMLSDLGLRNFVNTHESSTVQLLHKMKIFHKEIKKKKLLKRICSSFPPFVVMYNSIRAVECEGSKQLNTLTGQIMPLTLGLKSVDHKYLI